MAKKNLNPDGLINELKGGSLFFPTRSTPSESEKTSPASLNKQVSNNDTVIPRYHDTNVDTTIPSNHDTVIPEAEDEMLEAVRKAVK